MPNYQNATNITLATKLGEEPSLFDFGCTGNGGTDDSANFQKALTAVGTPGGGMLRIPRGNFMVTGPLSIPAGVYLQGYGLASRVFRGAGITAGSGILNPAGNDITLSNFLLDGMTTVPTKLIYSAFGSDPTNAQLSTNTSIWVKAAISRLRVDQLRVTHTGGYAIWLDGRLVSIDDVLIDTCTFYNNRPHLFGTVAGDAYGSWTGGIFYSNEGSNTTSVSNVRVQGCQWRRNTGTCFWGHSSSFGTSHRNINVIGNSFEDCGLDGTLFGNTLGGSVKGNQFHRVGYTTQTDVDTPLPKYQTAGANFAVAVDSTGFVSGVTYDGNTFISINGECIDLDGFRNGVVSNNVCIIPASGDPQFTEDSIGSYGIANSNITRGVGTNDSNMNGAGNNIVFSGNTWINMGESAMSLAYTKGCRVSGNRIMHPATATGAPIVLLSTAGSPETLNMNNTIEDNSIDYSAANFCIVEAGTGWTAAAVNHIFNNRCTGTNQGEFLRASGSGGTSASAVGTTMSTNDIAQSGSPWVNSANIIQREGSNATAAWKIYKSTSNAGVITNTQVFSLADIGPVLNVSAGGAVNTGAITTGNITSVGILHSIATQRIFSEAGFLSFHDTGTFDSAGDALDIASQAISAWCLLRYNKATGNIEKSSSTNATANRVWAVFGASGAAGGLDTYVQYNKTGVGFQGDINFTWAYTPQVLTITTKPVSGAGLILTDGVAAGGGLAYIYSNGGFFTPSTSAAAIHATAGGVTSVFVTATGNAYNAVQCSPTTGTAGMLANSFTALKYVQLGTSLGAPAVTGVGGSSPDAFRAGSIYWDTTVASPGLKVYNGTSWLAVGGVGASIAGSDKMVQYNAAGVFAADANFSWAYTPQILTVTTKPVSGAGLVLTDGNPGGTGVAYIQSNGGFLTPSTSLQSIQTAGGVTAAIGVFSSNLTNAVSLSAGGMTAALSVRVDNAFLSKAQATAPAYVPSAGYGGQTYQGGSKYWYWNGTAWLTIDYTAAGSASVAGATTQIQINNAGAFGAFANFTYDPVNFRAFVGTAVLPATPVFFSNARLCLYDNSSHSPTLQLIADTNIAGTNCHVNLQAFSGSSAGQGGIFSGTSSRGTLAAPSSTLAGDILFGLYGGGFTSALTITQAAISMTAGSNWSASNAETYIAFLNTPAGSTTLTERLRIASNGVILVNRTTTDGTGAQLMVNGIVSASSGLVSSLSSFNAISLTGVAGGFNVATGQFRSASFDSVSCVAAGGMSARSFTATTYVQVGNGATTPTLTTNDLLHPGCLYFDTGKVALQVWNGAAWVNTSPAGTATPPAGSSTQIQWNNGTVFGADANFTWSTGSHLLTINGASLQMAINVANFGFIQSAEGFVSNSSAGNAVKLPNGGITAAFGTFTSTLGNSIQTTGGVSCGSGASGGYYVAGTQAINNAGVFVGAGIIMTAGITLNGGNGISCSGISSPAGAATTTFVFPAPGFTVNGTTFHTMVFRANVLLTWS